MVDRQIRHVAHAAVARNDHRSAFDVVGWNHHLPKPVQPLEDALETASRLQVDRRVSRWIKEIPRTDDVGTPEQHDAVAVRRRRLVKDLHGLAVEVDVLLGP